MFNTLGLPPELWEDIWHCDLPEQRILWVTAVNDTIWKWCTSSHLVPTLLHVCPQSRSVCRRTYQRLPIPQPVYINYDKDIVLTRPHDSGQIKIPIDSYLTSLRLECIRHAGFLESSLYNSLENFPMARFASLQSLTVFIGDGLDSDVEFLDSNAPTGDTKPCITSCGELVIRVREFLVYTIAESYWEAQPDCEMFASCYASSLAEVNRLTIRCGRSKGLR